MLVAASHFVYESTSGIDLLIWKPTHDHILIKKLKDHSELKLFHSPQSVISIMTPHISIVFFWVPPLCPIPKLFVGVFHCAKLCFFASPLLLWPSAFIYYRCILWRGGKTFSGNELWHWKPKFNTRLHYQTYLLHLQHWKTFKYYFKLQSGGWYLWWLT